MSLHKSDSKSSIASSNKKEQIPSNETMAEFSTTHVHSTPQMMEIHEYQTEEKKTIDPSDTSVHIPTSFEVKHDNIASEDEEDEDEDEPGWFSRIYSRYRKWFHLSMFLIFTGFLAAAYALQVPKGYSQENLILGLIYAWFSLYMFFTYAPKSIVTRPWMFLVRTAGKPIMALPQRWRTLLYGFAVFAVIVVTVFAIDESPESNRVQRLIALFGVVVFLVALYASSTNRKAINWNTVIGGMFFQFVIALFVFRSKPGHDIFNWASNFAQGFLGKASYGTAFVFGDDVANSGTFAVAVFPAIIFFASTVQILYYYGALQWFLAKSAVFFQAILQVSGAEAIVAVASPFLGQSENALLVKPFMPYMTKSEMHQIMCSGFATISGSVLFGYISMGVSGEALLTSCIMSIPCSLAVSKIRMPETEVPLTAHEVRVPQSTDRPKNVLHAAGLGAATGIQVIFAIMGNLISLLALLYAVNAALTWLGNFVTIQNLTIQLITGYIFVPIAWLIGTDNKDLVSVGQLLATKIWANEFVAYDAMTTTYKGLLSYRSELVCTYALCGFANLSSVGVQIGVLTTIAPKRSGEVAKLAVSAMICGAFCTWISASIAGMLL